MSSCSPRSDIKRTNEQFIQVPDMNGRGHQKLETLPSSGVRRELRALITSQKPPSRVTAMFMLLVTDRLGY